MRLPCAYALRCIVHGAKMRVVDAAQNGSIRCRSHESLGITVELLADVRIHRHVRGISALLFRVLDLYLQNDDDVHSLTISARRAVSLPMRCPRCTHITGSVAEKGSSCSCCFGSLPWRRDRRSCGQRVFGANPALLVAVCACPVPHWDLPGCLIA